MGRHPIELHGCIHENENENMCRVVVSRDRHPIG